MSQISVIIPTLQKNKDLLLNLIKNLENDSDVEEIIIIDNSLNGLNYYNKKLKLIIPSTNLYVNPSWNLGVKNASFDNIAILNDDIAIPNNFCSSVFKKISKETGIAGCNIDFIIESRSTLQTPITKEIDLVPIANRCMHWGIAIFLKKTNYVEIPNNLKVFYGDDWLIYQCKKQNKKIYSICGQEIYHYGSLSSSATSLDHIAKQDKETYIQLTQNCRQKIFSFEKVYKGFRFVIFGIKILFHYKKKH